MAVINDVDAAEKAGELLLEQAADAAALVDAERRVEVGVPAERLADLADEEDAELIVVGSRGRGAFKAAFLGSVSNSLVGVARCPVVIVPPGAAGGVVNSQHGRDRRSGVRSARRPPRRAEGQGAGGPTLRLARSPVLRARSDTVADGQHRRAGRARLARSHLDVRPSTAKGSPGVS